MAKAKATPHPASLLAMMASKTAMRMNASTLADMGMAEKQRSRSGPRRLPVRSASRRS